MPRQFDRGLHFKAVGSAGAFEFEAAVVRDVDLFIRPVDQKQVSADRGPLEIERGAGLIEVSRRNAFSVGPPNDAARVLARNAAAVYFFS
jgi:hypothetical protein